MFAGPLGSPDEESPAKWLQGCGDGGALLKEAQPRPSGSPPSRAPFPAPPAEAWSAPQPFRSTPRVRPHGAEGTMPDGDGGLRPPARPHAWTHGDTAWDNSDPDSGFSPPRTPVRASSGWASSSCPGGSSRPPRGDVEPPSHRAGVSGLKNAAAVKPSCFLTIYLFI